MNDRGKRRWVVFIATFVMSDSSRSCCTSGTDLSGFPRRPDLRRSRLLRPPATPASERAPFLSRYRLRGTGSHFIFSLSPSVRGRREHSERNEKERIEGIHMDEGRGTRDAKGESPRGMSETANEHKPWEGGRGESRRDRQRRCIGTPVTTFAQVFIARPNLLGGFG